MSAICDENGRIMYTKDVAQNGYYSLIHDRTHMGMRREGGGEGFVFGILVMNFTHSVNFVQEVRA